MNAASKEIAPRRARAVLLFELGGQRYGLFGSDVRELVRAVSIAPSPKAPSIVLGVIDVRGALVPVVDVRRRFGLAPKAVAPSDYFIIAFAGARVVAIHVDDATDLVQVEDGDIEDAKATMPAARHVAGIVRLPDGLALVHDLRTFLDDAEALALDEALRSPGEGAP